MGATQSSGEQGIVTVVAARRPGDSEEPSHSSHGNNQALLEVERELAALGVQLQGLRLGIEPQSEGLTALSAPGSNARGARPGGDLAAATRASGSAGSPSRPTGAPVQLQHDGRDWLGLASYVVHAAQDSPAPAALSRELMAALRSYRSWIAQREAAAAAAQARLHRRMQQTDAAARAALERVQRSATAHSRAAADLEGQLGSLTAGLEQLTARVGAVCGELESSRQALRALRQRHQEQPERQQQQQQQQAQRGQEQEEQQL